MQSDWTRLGPAHWSALTYKRVEVHAHNGHVLRGHLVTVDPVSASLVLLMADAPGPGTVHMVLGHAVKQVLVLDSDLDSDLRTRLQTLFTDHGVDQDQSSCLDLDRTRTRLMDWIRLNLVPVEMQGEGLVVAGGVVTVNPPFRVQDCVGLNQVVLDRVQRLVQSCP